METSLIRVFLVLNLFLFVIGADYQTPIASLDNCPNGFTRVSNGCYFFDNSTAYLPTWTQAKDRCAAKIQNSTTHSHLLIVDTLAEAIALSFWFKGNNYTKSYWTGGYFDTSASLWKWDWSTLPYVKNNQISDANIDTKSYLYLSYNSTNQYDYRSADAGVMNYICEAQVLCTNSENACLNNGTCYVNVGRVFCACLPGYTGPQCELIIDNCLSVPCLHGGDCNNLINNYTCNCTQYYSGSSCEIANPDPLENLRNWVFYLCVSICLFLLGLLCLLDLPWIQIINITRHLFPSKTEKELKKVVKESSKIPEYKEFEDEKKKKQIDLIKAEVLMNSEEEMLKRFKAALIQNKNRARGTASPTHLDIDSRLSKRTYQNNYY